MRSFSFLKGVSLAFLKNSFYVADSYFAHTNRFCVVQENIKPGVFTVQTELARSVH